MSRMDGGRPSSLEGEGGTIERQLLNVAHYHQEKQEGLESWPGWARNALVEILGERLSLLQTPGGIVNREALYEHLSTPPQNSSDPQASE